MSEMTFVEALNQALREEMRRDRRGKSQLDERLSTVGDIDMSQMWRLW